MSTEAGALKDRHVLVVGGGHTLRDFVDYAMLIDLPDTGAAWLGF